MPVDLEVLKDRCLEGLWNADRHIEKFCAELSNQEVFELTETADQPLLFAVEDLAADGYTEFLRDLARTLVEKQVQSELKTAIKSMTEDMYTAAVQHGLGAAPTEEELDLVGRCYAAREMPHICARKIKEQRCRID